MQRDTTNTSSDCMTGYDSFLTLWTNLKTNLESDADYLAGIAAKGQGQGSTAGYELDKIEKYIDVATGATNVFNECDIDYYLQAISKATSNVAGFVNQAINTGYRSQETTQFADLATAIAAEDEATTAVLLGVFIKDFLMAEIPDKSQTGYYQDVGQLM